MRSIGMVRVRGCRNDMPAAYSRATFDFRHRLITNVFVSTQVDSSGKFGGLCLVLGARQRWNATVWIIALVVTKSELSAGWARSAPDRRAGVGG